MTDFSRLSELLKNTRLPAAIVDLETFDRNAVKLAGIASENKKRLRLATKSVRVPDLIARAKASSAAFQGLMCYSGQEAHFLAGLGHDDLLVAYPTVQSSELKALRELHESGKVVRLMIDSAEQAHAAAATMRGLKSPFRLLLDVDASLRPFGGLAHLGVRRSPLRAARDVLTLLETVAGMPEVRVDGAMVYEAQVAGLGDRNPFKKLMNPAAAIVRALSVKHVRRLRAETAVALRERAPGFSVFNGGGTGSLNYAATEKPLTEITAGSALFSPRLFDFYSNIRFEPSCFFALQVTRSSDPGFVTCQGGGYVASGEPGWDRVPSPYWPAGLKLIGTEACGEVQTPLKLPRGLKLVPGDPVFFRHAKAGELMERFNEVLLFRDGKITGTAKTYRGMGQSFI